MMQSQENTDGSGDMVTEISVIPLKNILEKIRSSILGIDDEDANNILA